MSIRFAPAAVLFILCPAVFAADYDPLAVTESFQPQVHLLAVKDSKREREIPLKVYLPSDKSPAPVVLFSHGLGGSREGGKYLGNHWSARGYVALFLQHPGSDTEVWKSVALRKRMQAMREAASGKNLILRVEDVPAVLDALTKWNAEAGHVLAKRLDLEHVGMSGHSFGAVTTQYVSGQSMPLVGQRHLESRVKAAVIMSPSTPRAGSAATAFAKVELPWLLMTGTKDTSPIGGQTVETRLAVYPELPAGDKYELVLHEAAHSAFSDRAARGSKHHPNHHRVILSLSTAFWDAYLRDNAAAKAWLEGKGPAGVLEPEDRWQKK